MTSDGNLPILRGFTSLVRRFGRRAGIAYFAYSILAAISLFPVIRAALAQWDLRALAEAWSGAGEQLGRVAYHIARLTSEFLRAAGYL